MPTNLSFHEGGRDSQGLPFIKMKNETFFLSSRIVFHTEMKMSFYLSGIVGFEQQRASTSPKGRVCVPGVPEHQDNSK